MTISRWTRLVRAASMAGFGAFALVTVALPADEAVSAFFNVWVYNGLLVLACVAAGTRALLVRQHRAAWIAFTAAMTSWLFGEVWYASVAPEAFPSAADVGFLGFYPLAYVGIVLLLRTRTRTVGGMLWLDGVTAALAAATLGAAALFELVLVTTEGSTATIATNLAYPLGDLLLLSAVFGAFVLVRWRLDLRLVLIGLGLLSTTLADSVYLFQSAAGTYVEGTWVDVLWPAAMLLIANAAWVRHDRAEMPDVTGRPQIAVPAICAGVALGVLVLDHFERVNLLAIVLASLTFLAVVVRLAATFHENARLFELTRREAATDALTGLGNRRKLVSDLESRFAASAPEPTLLLIYDLDGFKRYNDSFGHPAGDALLARLGSKLAAVPGDRGAAYRLGGDEFCVVSSLDEVDPERLIQRASDALSERGEGFEITSSFGAVLLPEEAGDPSEALGVADERLYAQKHSRRAESDRTLQALVEALTLREPGLEAHLEGVASLAVETGRMLGFRRDALDALAHAAELHDLGKLAVPDEILLKPGELDEREWAFVRQHTLVGERILRASPELRGVAAIVRSTHERWDGGGYPDGLAAQDIPLPARIIHACDAYVALTSERPYRGALAPEAALSELEQGAGTQFDPAVVHVVAARVRQRLEAERAA